LVVQAWKRVSLGWFAVHRLLGLVAGKGSRWRVVSLFGAYALPTDGREDGTFALAQSRVRLHRLQDVDHHPVDVARQRNVPEKAGEVPRLKIQRVPSARTVSGCGTPRPASQ